MRDLRRRGTMAAALGLSAALTALTVAPAPSAKASSWSVSSRVASPWSGSTPAADAVLRKAAAHGSVPAGGQERARPVCGPPYVKDDRRLGPKYLPRAGRLGRILRGYRRFGGLSPARFLRRYWDQSTEPQGWRYPPNDGFAHVGGFVNSRPIRARVRLAAGLELDRFGSEHGSFLAPAGTLFAGRALPPDSLNTRTDDPQHRCNYHVYRVARAFHVAAGPAEPAFQQIGRRRQYLLVSSYVPRAPSPLNVRWLVENGYLRRLN